MQELKKLLVLACSDESDERTNNKVHPGGEPDFGTFFHRGERGRKGEKRVRERGRVGEKEEEEEVYKEGYDGAREGVGGGQSRFFFFHATRAGRSVRISRKFPARNFLGRRNGHLPRL